MKIQKLIWLDEIVDKIIRKHSVQKNEVREILEQKPRFRFVEKGHRRGENVYAALGKSEKGRYLTVFFVYKKDQSALIVSARDMKRSERRKYEQR